MHLPIVKIGHPVLRHTADSLSAEQIREKVFQSFLDDMVETMRTAEGVGLAANQVGAAFSAFVLECKLNDRYPDKQDISLEFYMNIRIVEFSQKKVEDWEGCLSIPGYRGIVPRSEEVVIEALDRHGKKGVKTLSGFHARIIQHEADHLNGLFYMDRMPDLKSWMHLDAFNYQFDRRIRERP